MEPLDAGARGSRFGVPALLLALCAPSLPAVAAPTYRIADVASSSDYQNEFVVFNNHVYFAGGTTGTGIELWRTDGTEAGTTLVKDIRPGSTGSFPRYLTVVRDSLGAETLYFAATDATHGRELWKSDGTTAGTILVKDVVAGTGSSEPELLTAVLGQVAFRCNSPGYSICKSDGTDAGTLTRSLGNDAYGLFELNGEVYFTVSSGGYSYMWRWDLLGTPFMMSPVRVWGHVRAGGLIYFTSDNGKQIYRSDGTGVGTVKVLDLPTGKLGGSLTVVGPRIFFSCLDTATMDRDLWVFDGSAASQFSALEPLLLAEIDGALLFLADDGVHGRELWTVDGSTVRMIKDINPGPGASDVTLVLGNCFTGDELCQNAVAVGGSIYFFADDGVHGKELWKTDRDESGTVLVEDLTPGPASTSVFYGGARAYNEEYLAFGAAPETYGRYLLHVLSFSPPRFAIEDAATLPEGTGGSSNAVFTVHLVPPSTQDTSVQWTTSDGTAKAGEDFPAASGTVYFPAGTASQTLPVAINPDATPEVELESFNVQLSGSSGPPIGRGRAAVTMVNDDGPVISINDITVQESAGNATFTVTRSEATADQVNVDFATAAGSAGGSDFGSRTGAVIFYAGELAKQIVVPIVNDQSQEPDEVFFVRLSGPNFGVLGKPEGQCTIVSDDGAPALSVADVTAAEANAGTTGMTFTVTVSVASAYAVAVDYATADGTATAGADYQVQSGTLTIPAGASSGTIVVPIVGDVIDEPNETLTLTLSDPVNATLARALATGTITDNDTTTISVGNVTVTEGAAGATVSADFRVALNNPSSWTVTVDYATAPGTTNPATDGADYTGVSGTLSFPPGTTSLTVPVTVMGDGLDEGTSETFFLNLSNPAYATIPNPRATGTITDDDVARFTVGDVSVVEGHSGTATATLTVTLGSPYKSDSSVKYYTSNGTAVALPAPAPDFVGISNGAAAGAVLLSFPAGTISQQVTVEVHGDIVREVSNEYFNLNLTGAAGGPVIFDAQARVTILDDDLLPTDRRLSIAPASAAVTEPTSGTLPSSFTVSLLTASGTTPTPSGHVVTVSITAGGTATAPGDYTGIPASLTFPPGTSAQTITAAVESDAVLESPETVLLTLANPTNATIAAASATTSGSATLTIYDAISRLPLGFYTVAPCRVVDTRGAATGGPAPVAAGVPRSFLVVGVCGVPADARAISANVTVTGPTDLGHLKVYPAGTASPSTSNLNFVAGQTRANNAIILLGNLGDVTVAFGPTGSVHVVIDVNGYMQ